MNLLPFFLLFIAVIASFSYFQFENSIVQKKELALYQIFFRQNREIRNEIEKKKYRAHRKKRETDGARPAYQKKAATYFRDKKLRSPLGKLFIWPLLNGDEKEVEFFTDLLINYLTKIYGHASFFPKNRNQLVDLIGALKREYQERGPNTSFAELEIEDESMRWIFYKMVKGTLYYDVDETIGYPPLHDILGLGKKGQAPIHYHHAPTCLLQGVLGDKFANYWIEKEKEILAIKGKNKLAPLSQGEFLLELGAFFRENGKKYGELFEFSYLPSSYSLQKKSDKDSHITCKIQTHERPKAARVMQESSESKSTSSVRQSEKSK